MSSTDRERFIVEVQHTYKTYVEVEADDAEQAQERAANGILGKLDTTCVSSHHEHILRGFDHAGCRLKTKVAGTIPAGAVWTPFPFLSNWPLDLGR